MTGKRQLFDEVEKPSDDGHVEQSYIFVSMEIFFDYSEAGKVLLISGARILGFS